MKSYILKSYLTAAAALCLVGCQKESAVKTPAVETRPVTVNSILTKTSIDYEGDVSHLVWKDGDKVLYITNDSEGLYDLGFQEAVVDSNKFTANISSKATADNKLLVVWGGSATDLGGSDLRIWMKKTVSQKSTDEFNGKLLPMVALMNVPEGKEVSASYKPLASVLRVAIDSTGHASEKLKSIKISTAENCVGSYAVSTTAENGYEFKGSSNSVTVTLTDEPQLRDFKYVYIVVAKGAYTGVTAEVTTDVRTYTFEDGKMDVSAEDRGLFRMKLTLSTPPAPAEQKFVKVTDQSQIEVGGTYLIVSEKASGSYYVAINSESNGYLESTVLSCDADGAIVKTDDIVKNYAVTLEAGSGSFAGQYAIKMSGLGSTPYLKAPSNVSEAVGYVGKFWYGAAIAEQSNFFWTITVTDGSVRIGSHEFIGATGRTGGVAFFSDGSKFGVFAPESEDYAVAQLFKLQ